MHPEAVVDLIAVVTNHGKRQMSVTEWQMMPVGEQLSLVTSGRAKFFHDGIPVPVQEAMAALRSVTDV